MKNIKKSVKPSILVKRLKKVAKKGQKHFTFKLKLVSLHHGKRQKSNSPRLD